MTADRATLEAALDDDLLQDALSSVFDFRLGGIPANITESLAACVPSFLPPSR